MPGVAYVTRAARSGGHVRLRSLRDGVDAATVGASPDRRTRARLASARWRVRGGWTSRASCGCPRTVSTRPMLCGSCGGGRRPARRGGLRRRSRPHRHGAGVPCHHCGLPPGAVAYVRAGYTPARWRPRGSVGMSAASPSDAPPRSHCCFRSPPAAAGRDPAQTLPPREIRSGPCPQNGSSDPGRPP